jgi:hypothetical protein
MWYWYRDKYPLPRFIGWYFALCVLAYLLAIPVLLFLAIWKRQWGLLTAGLTMLGIVALAVFLIRMEQK